MPFIKNFIKVKQLATKLKFFLESLFLAHIVMDLVM